MKPYLLDTNVLIALAWPNHVHHSETQAWFARRGAVAFRTCPITQTGFVRISANPAFTTGAVSPGEALALLERVARLAGHDFWPDDLLLREAVGLSAALIGHRQVTDAYLLALARAHGGILATLDRAVSALAHGECAGALEIIA